MSRENWKLEPLIAADLLQSNPSGWGLIGDFVHTVILEGKTPSMEHLETIAHCFGRVLQGETFEQAFNVKRRDLSKEQKRKEHLVIGYRVYTSMKKTTLEHAEKEAALKFNCSQEKAHAAYLLFLKSYGLGKKK